MKYLILYIFVVFILYIYLKYYCSQNQLNRYFTSSVNTTLKNNNILFEGFYNNDITNNTNEYYRLFTQSKHPNSHDDYHKINEGYNNTNNIKWISFGTDISSPYIKQKKMEFREIQTPNIKIERFCPRVILNKLHFRDNIESITQQDRNEIALSNILAPKIIETYDNGRTKVKSFGLVLKKQFNSVNKLAKTFRAIRFKSDIVLPKEFNGPLIWKDYLSPITDQGKCGNCWAHASSAVLADRFAILSLGKIKFTPSPYELTVCSFDFDKVDIKNVWKNKDELEKMDKRMHENRSCNGNNLYDTATSLFSEGVTELSCFPDKFTTSGKYVNIGEIENTNNLPYCYSVTGLELDTCVDGKTPMRKYRCKTAYVCSKERDDISLKERKLMYDIYKYGPVIVGFMMFPDFVYNYDGKSIYTHSDKTGGDLGGHAVRLVGWGEETVNGELIKYWWIANSWGKDWGFNGYFKMERCLPDIQLEDNVMSILPDFPGMIIDDPNIEAVESDKSKDVQNYTGHTLDKITGYYNTSINKLQKCEIRGKMYPYINNSFIQYLPKYKEFFAAKVLEHIQSNKINDIPYYNDTPTYYCNQDYTSPLSLNDVQKSTTGTVSTNNNTNDDSVQPSESDIHKKICKIVQYDYFDIIYFAVAFFIGIIFYYIFYSVQPVQPVQQPVQPVKRPVQQQVQPVKRPVQQQVQPVKRPVQQQVQSVQQSVQQPVQQVQSVQQT